MLLSAVVNPLPRIVTAVPTGPEVGSRLAINGTSASVRLNRALGSLCNGVVQSACAGDTGIPSQISAKLPPLRAKITPITKQGHPARTQCVAARAFIQSTLCAIAEGACILLQCRRHKQFTEWRIQSRHKEIIGSRWFGQRSTGNITLLARVDAWPTGRSAPRISGQVKASTGQPDEPAIQTTIDCVPQPLVLRSRRDQHVVDDAADQASGCSARRRRPRPSRTPARSRWRHPGSKGVAGPSGLDRM
jgi:hypothetical protein